MTDLVLDRIRRLLVEADCRFDEMAHRAVSTAEEAAIVRGTALDEGVKSILFKADGEFALFALSAERELSSRALRRELGMRRTRFASRAELAQLTGLEPGSVPPFGRPVLPFDLYADPSIFLHEEVVFTAGSRERSIRMRSDDYRRIARPRVVSFSRAGGD